MGRNQNASRCDTVWFRLMRIRTRYAPSPTGDLHLGHLRSHLVTWLLARKSDGDIVMRVEDLDPPREVAGSAESILKVHEWMGLGWDEGPYFQSKRHRFYDSALSRLLEAQRAYPCACSRADIAALSAPHGELGAIYPGTCRDKRDIPAPHAMRFLVNDEDVSFTDGIFGSQNYRSAGDFVIRRKDNLFAYHLAVVVDDGLMDINTIVRGCDLLPSTPRHIELQQGLGFSTPEYFHLGLVLDAQTGKRLAKRWKSESLNELRAEGATPEMLLGKLAPSLGVQTEGDSIALQELLERFDLETARPFLRADYKV